MKTTKKYEHVVDAQFCKGNERDMKSEIGKVTSPAACAKKCYSISSMFLHGYDECWCELSSKDGVCDEQVVNVVNDGRGARRSKFKLFKYKLVSE